MKQFLGALLGLFLMVMPALAGQRTDLTCDLRKENPALRMTTTALTTPLWRVWLRENGIPVTNTTGWTALLYYSSNETAAAGMVITNTAQGRDWFEFRLTDAQTAMPGTNFAQIVIYGPTTEVEEWMRGTLTIRNGGLTGPFTPLVYNWTGVYNMAAIDAKFLTFSNGLNSVAFTGELDPLFTNSPAAGIVAGDTNALRQAYAWGNHATNGYVDRTVTNGLASASALSSATGSVYSAATNDVAQGLPYLRRNGTAEMAANLGMDGFKITSLGVPTTAADAARYDTVTGATNALGLETSAKVAALNARAGTNESAILALQNSNATVSANFYPRSNPSNYVDRTVTNGLASSAALSSATNAVYSAATNDAAQGIPYLRRNGSAEMAANLGMDGFKITSLGAPSASSDAARLDTVTAATNTLQTNAAALYVRRDGLAQTLNAGRYGVTNASTLSGTNLYLMDDTYPGQGLILNPYKFDVSDLDGRTYTWRHFMGEIMSYTELGGLSVPVLKVRGTNAATMTDIAGATNAGLASAKAYADALPKGMDAAVAAGNVVTGAAHTIYFTGGSGIFMDDGAIEMQQGDITLDFGRVRIGRTNAPAYYDEAVNYTNLIRILQGYQPGSGTGGGGGAPIGPIDGRFANLYATNIYAGAGGKVYDGGGNAYSTNTGTGTVQAAHVVAVVQAERNTLITSTGVFYDVSFAATNALGSEIITDGAFANDGASWPAYNVVWASHQAKVLAGSTGNVQQATAHLVGRVYVLQYDFSTADVGPVVSVWAGNTNSIVATEASGRVTLVLEARNTNGLALSVYAQSADITLDNVSLKEVTRGEVRIARDTWVGGDLYVKGTNVNTAIAREAQAAGAGVSNSLAAMLVAGTNAAAADEATKRTAATNALALDVETKRAAGTNGLASTNFVSVNYYPRTNPSNYVDRTVTNGLASTNALAAAVEPYYPRSNPSNYVPASVTNGLASTGLVASTYYPRSNPSNFVLEAAVTGKLDTTTFEGTNALVAQQLLTITNQLAVLNTGKVATADWQNTNALLAAGVTSAQGNAEIALAWGNHGTNGYMRNDTTNSMPTLWVNLFGATTDVYVGRSLFVGSTNVMEQLSARASMTELQEATNDLRGNLAALVNGATNGAVQIATNDADVMASGKLDAAVASILVGTMQRYTAYNGAICRVDVRASATGITAAVEGTAVTLTIPSGVVLGSVKVRWPADYGTYFDIDLGTNDMVNQSWSTRWGCTATAFREDTGAAISTAAPRLQSGTSTVRMSGLISSPSSVTNHVIMEF